MATGFWRTTKIRLVSPAALTGIWQTTKIRFTLPTPANGSWQTTKIQLLTPRSITGNWRTTKMALVLPTSGVKPIANAGVNQTRSCAELVTLDGRASSSTNGTVSSYTWRLISTDGGTPTLSSTSIAQPTFRVPIASTQQTLSFGLIVHDSAGGVSPEDQVVVSVYPADIYTAGASAWLPAGVLSATSSGWL